MTQLKSDLILLLLTLLHWAQSESASPLIGQTMGLHIVATYDLHYNNNKLQVVGINLALLQTQFFFDETI